MRAHVRSTWLLGLLLTGACGQSEVALPSEAEDPRASAIRIAQMEVEQTAGLTETDGWTSQSRVVEAYPIIGAGRDGIAYYEAKVVTGGEETGFVLVNVDKTDLLIPESVTMGQTLTETYRGQLGRDDLRVVRYDWFRSAAFDPAGQRLASRGFENDSDPTATMARLEAESGDKGVFPLYSRAAIAAYYESLKAPAPAPASGNVEETTQALESREFYAELKHTFVKTGGHLPQWVQPYKADGYPLGCGAMSWGLVYAYWRQFKGASRLFGGNDLTNYSDKASTYYLTSSFVGPFIESCATAIDTVYEIDDGVKSGASWPWNMCKATKVANDLGYSASCNRYNGISEYTKFDYAYGSLTDDRPVILTVGDHFVGIEAGRKTQMRTIGWHDRNVSYLANYGWGEPAKWITVRDWGKNQNEVVGSYSLFTLNMTLPASHGGSIFMNHEYKLHNWNATLQEAHYTCARQGGRLVSIGSAEENEFLRKLIPSGVSQVWIGLTYESGSWKWADGGSFSYLNWNPGEPSTIGSFDIYGAMLSSGKWDNTRDIWSMPFICEWE